MAACVPAYLPLMHQLLLLPPVRQAELVMVVHTKPVLMATLNLACPCTHHLVQNFAELPREHTEDIIRVCFPCTFHECMCYQDATDNWAT